MAITAVGTWASANAGAVSSYALSFTTVTAGDLVILMAATNNSPPRTVSSVSGDGVTWDAAAMVSYAAGSNWIITMWKGVVTTPTAGSITVTLSGTPGAFYVQAQEWTSGNGSGSTWTLDKTGTYTTTSSTTVVTFPSITPTNAGELYAGYAQCNSASSTGSTTGFSYEAALGNILAYDLNTGTSALQPTASQGTANPSWTAAVTIIAGGGTTFIAPEPVVISQAVPRASFY